MTPFEEFFTGLIVIRQAKGSVTPDSIERLLEEFRADFDDALVVARQLNSQYRELVAAG